MDRGGGPPSPTELARVIVGAGRPLVVAFDVDGTLAPLAPHPTLSVLLDGVSASMARLSRGNGVTVAVVSGRPWLDLTTQYEFPPGVVVIGSHGLEFGRSGTLLEPAEGRVIAKLSMLAGSAAAQAAGAWVEHKPAGVALHIRQADPVAGAAAVDWLLDRLARFEQSAAADPLEVIGGHDVIEVSLRRYDKGVAIDQLRSEHPGAVVVFVGDDRTDERAFARLQPGDVGIKVGDGPTLASYRLADPYEVAEFLAELARRVA